MKFELVTPQKLVFSADDVSYVQVPGVEGDFGVLPGHMPFISTLREDAPLSVRHHDGRVDKYIIHGGYVEVAGDLKDKTVVTALVEEIEEEEHLASE